MEEDHVVLRNLDVETYQEEKTSVAYPQLRTIYRKRIIPARLKSTTNPMIINAGSPDENLQGVTEDCPHLGNPVILGTEHISFGSKQRESEVSSSTARDSGCPNSCGFYIKPSVLE